MRAPLETKKEGITMNIIQCYAPTNDNLKKHHHKEWISIEALDRIKERKNKKTAISNSRTRAEKVQVQAEYIEANNQVKKSIKTDKRNKPASSCGGN
ncbi:unnamed protein product [Schistosoma mattheei]|uniref:Uncharacterized protein n=1 Tax=Schistosoma mattheei TaxID=31246 RepID=A0A183P2S1_9TREM|nr:unnamed protein product [Schistosoma mattheei]